MRSLSLISKYIGIYCYVKLQPAVPSRSYFLMHSCASVGCKFFKCSFYLRRQLHRSIDMWTNMYKQISLYNEFLQLDLHSYMNFTLLWRRKWSTERAYNIYVFRKISQSPTRNKIPNKIRVVERILLYFLSVNRYAAHCTDIIDSFLIVHTSGPCSSQYNNSAVRDNFK